MKALFSLLFICILLSSCSDTSKDKSVAEVQVAKFHDRLDSGQYDIIYNATAREFKRITPKEKMDELFFAIRRKLGVVKSSKIINWHVDVHNFTTTFVVLVSKTEFEKGEGTETFTFVVSGSKASLIGYNMTSMDMMLK